MFDTLVYRKNKEPYSIFEKVESKLGIKNFKKQRIEAEKDTKIKTFENIYKTLKKNIIILMI